MRVFLGFVGADAPSIFARRASLYFESVDWSWISSQDIPEGLVAGLDRTLEDFRVAAAAGRISSGDVRGDCVVLKRSIESQLPASIHGTHYTRTRSQRTWNPRSIMYLLRSSGVPFYVSVEPGTGTSPVLTNANTGLGGARRLAVCIVLAIIDR